MAALQASFSRLEHKVSKVIAGILVGLSFCAVASAASPKRANLPQVARNLVKAGAPGALVYVRTPTAARAGTAGFADVGAHVTMRAGDRWRIASVSKAFVATLVLQLEADGKLDIDDPVERWLPGVVPNGGAITLRELLNHTSGLYNYTDDNDWITAAVGNPMRAWAPRELVAIALTHPALFPPGSNWAYSNANYILLGLVVEAATGDNLGDELQRRIFTPLALASTSFPQTIVLAPDFVHGYFGQDRTDIAPLLTPTWAWAAGGIVSNARDVTTFYRALLTGRLLPAAQLNEMKVPAPVAGTYGLGIFSTFTACGHAFGHDGDFFGWRTEVLATANGKREAVVMVNIDATFVPWSRLEATVKTALCRG
jgi:D-alanyl-D-alanine carboxypeptidase